MAGISDYFKNFLLNHILRGEGTFPSTLYICLCTVTVTESMTGTSITETTYSGYTRVAVTVDTSTFDASTSDSSLNGGSAITFPQSSTTGGGDIIDVAVCDASTLGNLLLYGTLDSSLTPNSGDSPSFDIDALEFTITVSLPE